MLTSCAAAPLLSESSCRVRATNCDSDRCTNNAKYIVYILIRINCSFKNKKLKKGKSKTHNVSKNTTCQMHIYAQRKREITWTLNIDILSHFHVCLSLRVRRHSRREHHVKHAQCEWTVGRWCSSAFSAQYSSYLKACSHSRPTDLTQLQLSSVGRMWTRLNSTGRRENHDYRSSVRVTMTIYQISYDLSQLYLKFIVWFTCDGELRPAKISLMNIVS